METVLVSSAAVDAAMSLPGGTNGLILGCYTRRGAYLCTILHDVQQSSHGSDWARALSCVPVGVDILGGFVVDRPEEGIEWTKRSEGPNGSAPAKTDIGMLRASLQLDALCPDCADSDSIDGDFQENLRQLRGSWSW